MKKLKTIVFILIILLIVGMTLFFSREENQKKLVNYIYSFDKTQKEFHIGEIYEKEGIYYLNGRFLEWNSEKLTLLDANEKVLWTKTFLFENPKIILNENRIVIYNEETGLLYLYNGNGETLLEEDLQKPIFNIKVSDQGLILHLKLEESEELLNYNFDTNKWDKVSFIDTFPLDYWINNSNNLMYTQVKSKQNHLSSEVYEKTLDSTVLKTELKDSLILKVLNFKGGYIILTDTGIVKIKSGEDSIVKDFDLVHDLLIDGDEIYILSGDNLEVLNSDLERVHKKTYVLSYTSLHRHEKYILLYGEKNIVALFNKEDKAEYAFGSGIQNVTSQFNDLIVTLKTGVYTMRIKDVKSEKTEE